MKKVTIISLVLMFAGLFSYQSYASEGGKDVVTIATIAELLEEEFGTETVYELTGEVVLTYQQDFRNQKYIQDDTGGIMIDDAPDGNFNPGVIVTEYSLYDGITGLKGTLSIFGNMRQFVPTEDPGAATSEDNVVVPIVIDMAEYLANFMDYQSRLITITEVSFSNPGVNFANGQVYEFTDGDNVASFRTTFFGVDYIGTPIPAGPFNITGLPNSRADGDYFTARFTADFEALAAYDVTFSVIDEQDNVINDAVVTLMGQTNAAGDYFFADVPGGTHAYTIVKAGFYTRQGTITVSEEDLNVTIVIVEISPDLVEAFPWGEDFEAGSVPPATWAHFAYGAGSWNVTGDTPYGNHAALHARTTAQSESWLVSPQIQLPEDQAMLLTFFQKNSFMPNYTPGESLSGVMISTGSGNPDHGDFQLVYEAASPIETYSERIVGLGDYAGKVIYIAFAYKGAGSHNWYIDNIEIEEAPEAIEVANIAELYDMDPEDGDLVYRITGEVFITHQQLPYRNQIYIQDNTAAILIDDNAGIITTAYSNYDGIVNLTGTLYAFQNMLQIIPTEDPGPASSNDNVIDPMEVTLSHLTEDIVGKLVIVRHVTFDFDHEEFPDSEIFTHNQSYYILDATGEGVIRTPNSPDLLDYFGTEIPTTPKDIVGVLHQRFDVTRLQPRSLADFLEPTSVQEFEAAGFSVYPNPARNHVTITGESTMDQIRIYNLNGQLLQSKQVNGQHVSIETESLKTGIYIVQIVSGVQVLNYKLQIQK